MNQVNETVATFVKDIAVTLDRPPYNPPTKQQKLVNPGTARANIAPSVDQPLGTRDEHYAEIHSRQTVLQQHCDFFDRDKDGIVRPYDTYYGFRALGFNLLITLFSVFIIHVSFSWITSDHLFPQMSLPININNIHKGKHGSDSGTYDNEGRFVPQKFEDIFAKYGDGKDGLSKRDIWDAVKGQRVMADPFGWFGALFEWVSLYLLLWPKDGVIKKEDIRRMYDGSLFYEIAEERKAPKAKKPKAKAN